MIIDSLEVEAAPHEVLTHQIVKKLPIIKMHGEVRVVRVVPCTYCLLCSLRVFFQRKIQPDRKGRHHVIDPSTLKLADTAVKYFASMHFLERSIFEALLLSK